MNKNICLTSAKIKTRFTTQCIFWVGVFAREPRVNERWNLFIWYDIYASILEIGIQRLLAIVSIVSVDLFVFPDEIESNEMPLVSFKTKYTYKEPSMQTVARPSMHTCKPNLTISIGNNFKHANETRFRNTLQMVSPTVRIWKYHFLLHFVEYLIELKNKNKTKI